jgi:hypothetical protein
MPTTSSDQLHSAGNPNPDADEWDGCAAGDNPAAATTSERSVTDNARPSNTTMIVYSYLLLLLLTVAHGAGGEVRKDGKRGGVGVSGVEARRALAGRGWGGRHRRVPQEQVSAFCHRADG